MATTHPQQLDGIFAKLEAAADAAHLRSFGGFVRVPEQARARVALSLNRCIEAATDAEKTYALAATNVRESRLRVLLHDQAKRRGALVGELQGMLQSLGCYAENEGTTMGALRRGLFDVKIALGGPTGREILAECDRADDRALAVYLEAQRELDEVGVADVKALVDAQRGILLAGRTGMRSLLAQAVRR